MRPMFGSLIGRLDLGHYAIHIDQHGRAASVPITRRERSEFEGIGHIYAGCGQHPRATEPGLYLVSVDQHHSATDIIGLNGAEARAFLTEIMGAYRMLCRCHGCRNKFYTSSAKVDVLANPYRECYICPTCDFRNDRLLLDVVN